MGTAPRIAAYRLFARYSYAPVHGTGVSSCLLTTASATQVLEPTAGDDSAHSVGSGELSPSLSISSAAAAHFATPPAKTTSHRPRLVALREKLKAADGVHNDNDNQAGDLYKFTQTSVSVSKSRAMPNSSSKSKSNERTKNDIHSIDDLVATINALPDIEYDGNTHSKMNMMNTYTNTGMNTQIDGATVLTDTFGRHHSYLRISLSERCNLRCLYCMPADGVPLQPESHLLTDDEIVRLVGWFIDHGVTKIRLTGGEPLLRKGLVQLIQRLKDLSPKIEQIGMTTNGLTLSKHLPDLVQAGLTHVNVSLDSLDADKFAKLTRRPASYHTRVMQALTDCSNLLPPQRVKVNCVVLPDNADELDEFCKLTKSGDGPYRNPIDVRFIEFMPFSDNLWQSGGFVSYQDMQNRIAGAGVTLDRIEDGPNDTTKWWSLDKRAGGGRIGFITSMSQHFCGTCNRLRLTSDGQLKVCLFGIAEVSLRDLLRHEVYGQDEELLRKVIAYSVRRKHFSLGGHKDMLALQAHSAENRPMTLIGG